MKFPFGEKTTISRLRVPYSGDQLAVRSRYENWFGGMDLHPASLPPKAVVCIRKLRDPQLQTLELNRAAWQFSDNWRDSVSGEIEKLYRRAYRPILETVPAQAESIVFDNYAELLATLANDWCKSVLFQNWWWKSLFPNLERAQTVARIWIEAAQFAPTALQILAGERNAVEFVKKLTTDESQSLLEEIIIIFGLSKLKNALVTATTKEEKNHIQKAIESKPEKTLKKTEFEIFVQTDFPAKFISETHFRNLSFERKILLAVGFLLACEPRAARSSEFARQVRQLKIEAEFLQNPLKPENETISEYKTIVKKKLEKIGEIVKLKNKKNSRLIFSKPETKPENYQKQKTETSIKKTENKENRTEEKEKVFPEQDSTILLPEEIKIKAKKISFEKEQIENSPETIEDKKNLKDLPIAQPENFPAFSSETVEEKETELFDAVIHSRFGGVFYLLNLGLFLGLYNDFSGNSGEEIELNIWDFVALSSYEFIGEDFKEDEAWNLLAQLAGRADEKDFGQDFNAPDEWRISPEWLKTFQTNEKWFWSKSGDRLIVRHSENFCVIDVPFDGFENKLENELKIYNEFFNDIEEITAEEFLPELNASQRWLDYFFDFAERRLRQALNLETRNELIKVLFEKDATVAVSESYFDATFSLAELPLEVRFSGLDRNPGWIPAAGKYVEFHFV